MIQLSFSAQQTLRKLEYEILKLKPEQFCMQSQILSGSSIGQHVRHIIEFFTCLLQGYKSGKVNYDLRAHDAVIENDIELAIAQIRMLQDFLNTAPVSKNLILETAYHLQDHTWLQVETTFDRELAYCIDHAVHHMAMIKMGMKSVATEVVPEPGFGMAFSTLRNQKQKEGVTER
ncbi:MAG: hypothetical protein ACO3FI_01745 [Cyclobacteriaceae bacterium]